MSLKTTMVLFDDGDFAYLSTCGRCDFVSPMLADEDETFFAWRDHRCARPLS
jgi:hypothetical protein